MALGAFLGGVLLAESEYRRELETDVEPFKGLLLGLFFMAVGMSGRLRRAGAAAARHWWRLLLLGFMGVKSAGDVPAWRAAWACRQAERPVFVHAAGARRRVRLRGVPAGRGRTGRCHGCRHVASVLIGGGGTESMLVTPLLMVVIDRLWCCRATPAPPRATMHRACPTLDEPQEAPVLICRLRPLRPDRRPPALSPTA